VARPDTRGPSTTARATLRVDVPDWSMRRGLVGSLPGRRSQRAALLVIDGNHGHWSPVADTLRAAGYTVIQACPGQEATRMVEHLRFAAIVVDAGSSAFDDGSLRPATGDRPPVVVLSACDDSGQGGSGSRRAVARLHKPVSPLELVGAVARAIGIDPR